MDATHWFRSLYRLLLLSICGYVASHTLLTHSTAHASANSPTTVIYTARKIITMDPSQPTASAVAVKDGKILSVGSLQEMEAWMKPGTYRIDNQFYDYIITPGMIESHAHISMLILFLGHPYIGYHNALGFDASILPGVQSHEKIILTLKNHERDLGHPEDTLFAWGYDPIFFKDQPLTAAKLDKVSSKRPIFILGASARTAYVNSVLLKKAGITAASQTPGIEKDISGNPTGILKSDAAILLVFNVISGEMLQPEEIRNGLESTANLANHVGVTTISDMFFAGQPEDVFLKELKRAAKNRYFPVRIVIVQSGPKFAEMETRQPGSGTRHIAKLKEYETDKLFIKGIRFILDGAIQDFTAAIKWPGYLKQKQDKTITTNKEEIKKSILPFWKAGIPLHIHANGNQATDDALDILEYLQNTSPRRDAVFVLEHNQMSSEEQFVRAKKLGAYTNLIPNQIYYLGDQYHDIILGPDRANALNNTAEAKRAGVRFAIHTNTPETPLSPLHSMWAAVNRTTASGRVLGKNNSITPHEALEAVTINAAYMLNLQDKIGSIEVGKNADFTILKYDPLTIRPYTIKDIPVIATVVDGMIHPVRARSSF